MLKKIASIAAICTVLGVGGYFAFNTIKNPKFEPVNDKLIQLPEEAGTEKQTTSSQESFTGPNDALLQILNENPNNVNEKKLRKNLELFGRNHLKINERETSMNLLEVLTHDFTVPNYKDSIIFLSGAWEDNTIKYNEESESFVCTQILLRSLNRPYIGIYQIIPKEFFNHDRESSLYMNTLPEGTQVPMILIFDEGFNGKSNELHQGNISKKNLTYSCFDLPYFEGEVVFDKTKTNENAKSLAELIIATIEGGPSRVADDCIKKLFNKQY